MDFNDHGDFSTPPLIIAMALAPVMLAPVMMVTGIVLRPSRPRPGSAERRNAAGSPAR